MKSIHRLLVLCLVLASLALAGCGARGVPVTGTDKVPPSKLEPIEGSDIQRVLLTEKAAQRIDVQTARVDTRMVDGSTRSVLPYAAVIYDVEGHTWVYTNPEPLVYVRQAVEIETIDGDFAILKGRWDSKAPVVIVGVAEIYGAETGVSK